MILGIHFVVNYSCYKGPQYQGLSGPSGVEVDRICQQDDGTRIYALSPQTTSGLGTQYLGHRKGR